MKLRWWLGPGGFHSSRRGLEQRKSGWLVLWWTTWLEPGTDKLKQPCLAPLEAPVTGVFRPIAANNRPPALDGSNLRRMNLDLEPGYAFSDPSPIPSSHLYGVLVGISRAESIKNRNNICREIPPPCETSPSIHSPWENGQAPSYNTSISFIFHEVKSLPPIIPQPRGVRTSPRLDKLNRALPPMILRAPGAADMQNVTLQRGRMRNIFGIIIRSWAVRRRFGRR